MALSACVWISEEEHAARVDYDGDGLVAVEYGGLDCDDQDALVGEVREFFADDDGDSFGDPTRSRTSCEADEGFVDGGGDCDDQDSEVHPDALELCSDGVDNNCDGLTCLPPGELELPAGVQLTGSLNGERFGHRVDARGDADGDGQQDLLVAAPDRAPGGAVSLYLGPVLSDDAVPALVIEAQESGDALGWQIAWLDRGNDGVNEPVVSAPDWDLSSSVRNAGLVVVANDPLGPAQSLFELGMTITGTQADERLGAGLAVVERGADLPNQLMVGMPGYDVLDFPQDIEDGGRWALFKPGEGEHTVDDAEHAIDGTSVWTVGQGPVVTADFSGDGQLEVVVLGFSATQGQEAVFLLGPELNDYFEVEDAGFSITQGALGQGLSLAAADINGSGRATLLVGAPQNDGAVNLYLGGVANDTDQPNLTVLGTSRQGLGMSVEVGPDLDGDGTPEVVVGASEHAVVVSVASLQGGTLELGEDDLRVTASDAGAQLTATLGGDLNGDDVHDLVLAEPGLDAGRVYLMFAGGL